MSSRFNLIRPWTAELAALERLKKKHYYIFNGRNDVIILAPLFLIGSGNNDMH